MTVYTGDYVELSALYYNNTSIMNEPDNAGLYQLTQDNFLRTDDRILISGNATLRDSLLLDHLFYQYISLSWTYDSGLSVCNISMIIIWSGFCRCELLWVIFDYWMLPVRFLRWHVFCYPLMLASCCMYIVFLRMCTIFLALPLFLDWTFYLLVLQYLLPNSDSHVMKVSDHQIWVLVV